jgi:hypothetical protein
MFTVGSAIGWALFSATVGWVAGYVRVAYQQYFNTSMMR